jgi:hypothetical protein
MAARIDTSPQRPYAKTAKMLFSPMATTSLAVFDLGKNSFFGVRQNIVAEK